MISAATLQTWVPGGNAALLATIEAGVVAEISRESGLTLSTPRAAAEPWILDVAEIRSGGLTRYNAGAIQRITLPEPPQRKLSGTWTVVANSTALAGTSGAALTELSTDSAVEIAGKTHAVASITDNNTVTLATAHIAGASAVTIYSDFLRVSVRTAPTGAWSALDPVDDVELDRETGLELFSKAWSFPSGRRTVKVEPFLGYAEDGGPAEVTALIRDMVRAWFRRPAMDLASVKVDVISMTFADFGNSADTFRMRARRLGPPLLRRAA